MSRSYFDSPQEAPAVAPPDPSDAEAWRPARFWRRAVAYFVDGLLLSIPVGYVKASVTPMFEEPRMAALARLTVGVTIFVLYEASMMSSRSGMTVGKHAMGIHVVRADGAPLTFERTAGRALAKYLSVFSAGLGFLWMLVDRRRRTWHDVLAGTVARERRHAAPAVVSPADGERAASEGA